MGKPFSLQSPEQVAKEYGGNKQKIAQAAQMGQVDPTAAVLAGMFIDRMRSAQSLEQGAQPTVAQQVLAPPAPASAPPAPPASGAPPMGMAPPMAPQAPPMAPQAPPMGMASGGLTTLPIPDDMFDEQRYGGGGIVAFSGKDGSGLVESDPFRPSLSPEGVARAYKGLTEDPYLSQRDRLANMTTEELTELRRMPPYMREQFGPSFLIEEAIASKVGAEDELRAAQLKIPPMEPIPDAPPFSVEIPRAPVPETRPGAPASAPLNAPTKEGSLKDAGPSVLNDRMLADILAKNKAAPAASTAEMFFGRDNAAPAQERKTTPKETRPGLGDPRVDPEVTKAVADVAEAAPVTEKDYAAYLKEAMAAREGYPTLFTGESIADQKKQDFNMALAQMGFGIAAGTSPNALTNIGAGMSGAVPGMQKAMDRRREAQRDADKADFARREAVYGQKNAARTEALGLVKADLERKDAQAELASRVSEGGLDRRSAEIIARERNATSLQAAQAGMGAPTAALQTAAAIKAENPGMTTTEALQLFYAMSERAGTDQTLAYRDNAAAAAQTDGRWRQAKTEAARKALIDEYYRAMYGGSAAAPAPTGAKFLGME